MKRWPLAGSRVAGAMTAWTGNATFDRAPLVLARPDEPEAYLIVRRYTEDCAEGANATAAEWRALTRSGDAMEIGGLPDPKPGSWLWLLRRHLPLDRQEAVEVMRAERRLIGDTVTGPDDGAWACVVVDTGAEEIREAWASALTQRARDRVGQRDWPGAGRLAEAAFDVEPVMTPSRIALLVRICRARDDTVGAEGYLSVAETTGGSAFIQEVHRELRRLETDDGGERIGTSRTVSRMQEARRRSLGKPPIEQKDAA